MARDRWQLHLKTRGDYYNQWAARLEALHARQPESGANYAALSMRALAVILERCRIDRLTRNQHVLFRLGEWIAWTETAALFSERVADKPTTAIALEARARSYRRQATLKVATDGREWPIGAGQTDPQLANSLNLPAIYQAQAGLISDMDFAAAQLTKTFHI